MKNFFLLLPIILRCFLFPHAAVAQQYSWVKNNGAAAALGSMVSMSVNSSNETWIIPSTNSATRFFGAGRGTAPDLGPLEVTTGQLQRYDDHMNLVFSGACSGLVAADPLDPRQFYLTSSFSGTSVSVYGLPVTGQVAATSVFLAKCRTSGTGGIVSLWITKIDGLSDEEPRDIRVKDIGGGHVRIAIQGSSRSAAISNYADGTTGIAQTVAVPGGNGSNTYNTFISCFDDAVSGGSSVPVPLWINTFGNSSISVNTQWPIELNEHGDVVFIQRYAHNALGTTNYTLTNSSGAAPGNVVATNYAADINTDLRYILFRFAAADGRVAAVKNELRSVICDMEPGGLATDAAGNVYLYAILYGSYDPGGDAVPLLSAGSNDLAVIRFDSSLAATEAQRYGDAGDNSNNFFNLNSFAIDPTHNRLYMAGYTNSGFTAGAATVQQVSGYDGFILAVDAATLEGLSAVSCIGTGVAGSTEIFGSVAVRPDGVLIGAQQYTAAAHNRLNAALTPLLPKMAYGYQDVALTAFDAATLLNPLQEGGWGGTTDNRILASALKGPNLLSMGYYNGSMTVGGSTISGSGTLLVVSDTATGDIRSVRDLKGGFTRQMKLSAQDGAIYLAGETAGDLTLPDGTVPGKAALGAQDVYLTKLDTGFHHLWTVLIGGIEKEQVSGLEVDPVTGDVYLLGNFLSAALRLNPAGGTAYGSTAIAANSNAGLPISADVYVAKFSSSGAFQWITTGGSASAFVNDLAAYPALKWMNGSLYFGASSSGNTTFGFGGRSVTAGNNPDMILGSLDPATGGANWLKTWTGNNGTEAITSLAAYDNLLYVGGTSDASSGLTLGGVPFSAAMTDGFIFTVDTSGVEQTGLFQTGGNGNDRILEIKPDAVGNIFFTGSSSSSSLPIAGSTLGSSGGDDCLVGAIDAASLGPRFGFLSGSVNEELYSTITPGKVGMLFTGGNLKGSATFGNIVVPGRLGGDFTVGRIDYPFIAPGAQVSNLNAWYKANVLAAGNPVTGWTNSNATNPLLPGLAATGTVTTAPVGLNFNPTVAVGSGNELSRGSIYVPNFLDASGSRYSIYVVFKPAGTGAWLQLWSESSTGTAVALGAPGNMVTGSGGTKMTVHPTALSNGQYSISSLLVNGPVMSNWVNGAASGSQPGVTALSTTQSGSFRIGGTGNMEVAEVVTYGGAHTAADPPIDRIETYLAIKYGITLHHHYYSTTGDTLYKAGGRYANNIAGIGVDSNEVLMQLQSRSQNTGNKGDMVTIGAGSIAASNAANTAAVSRDGSYLVWGDDTASVTARSKSGMPAGISSCGYRLPRAWQLVRTGSGIGATQVRLDLNGTAAETAPAADLQLLIDQDGDGDFTTGAITYVRAAGYDSGRATFNNVVWDADASGSDVFAVAVDAASNILTPALVNAAASLPVAAHPCLDGKGFLQFADTAGSPVLKYAAFHPHGNSGYTLTVYASNDSGNYINNQMKTDGISNTTALMNRMYTVKDAGPGNYPAGGGITVRLYYSAADSLAAVAALDPAVSGGNVSFSWFKVAGGSNGTAAYSASVATAKAAQLATGMNAWPPFGATLLTPARYGMEGGVRYAEFDNLQDFGTFGALAKRGAALTLPVQLASFTAAVQDCGVRLLWKWSLTGADGPAAFEVERSMQGSAFEKIGAVPATEASVYSCTVPHAGKYLFRLRWVEAGGQVRYSPALSVQASGCTADNITIMPNPASSFATISIGNGTGRQYRYEVLDGAGRRMKSGLLQGGTANTLSTKDLAGGTYTVRIRTENGVLVKKLVVAR